MGKRSYRFRTFRLSEMMPNSWFYKLRDLGNRGSGGSGGSKKMQNSMEKGQVPIMETGKSFENQNPITEPSQKHDRISNRRSYYIPSRNRVEKLPYFPTNPKVTDTHIPLDRPRKNKTKLRDNPLSTHNKRFSSSVSSVNTCQEQSASVLSSESAHETPLQHFNGVFTDELNTTDHNISIPLSPIVTKPIKNETNKPKLAVESSEPAHETPLHHLNGVLTDEINTTDYNLSIPLPPIVTKPIKKETNKPNLAVGNQRSKQGRLYSHGNTRRPSTPQTPRIKMRLHSSKPAEMKLREKKGLADSFAVVKLSSDPQSDFKESMLEMILQNNLWASKDLEELLACYLYLNSDEYHDLIVKGFKQILLDLSIMNLHFK